MSSDGEKPFDATPSRIAKAKREGNVVRAQEFGGNVSFLGASIATAIALPHMGPPMRSVLRSATLHGSLPAADLAAFMGWSLLPLCSAGALGAFASIVQTGGIQINGIAAKFGRLSPKTGLMRMFSREAVSHGARAVAGVAVVVPSVLPSMYELFAVSTRVSGSSELASATWRATTHVVGAICSVGVVFALLEFWIARRDWFKKLRMTLDEYKRELREHDGDPAVRARRKAAHRALLGRGMTRVKDASFVVVNPTHVAVAVDYRPPDVPVPVIVVRATDEMALRVREQALLHGVPIVENVALARALYADGRLDAPIPLEHYVAVAEVISHLLRAGILE